MADQLQLRRGTTAENDAFTGAEGEVTIDTDKHVVVIHDGVNAGGYPQANELTVDERVILFDDDTSGGSAADAYVLTPEINTIKPDQYVDGMYLSFITANANTGAATANFNGLGVKSIKKPDGSDPLAGEVNDRVVVIYDADNDWFELQLFQPFDADTAKTDVNQIFTKAQRSGVTTLTDGANISIDLSANNRFEVTLEGNRTLENPSNAVKGQSGRITVVQDATGSRTLAYGSNYLNTPTLSTTANAVDILPYETVDIGGTVYVLFGTILPDVVNL